ncbi:MAG: MFS transporter [Actinomycetota bacterium]|nr:MFS transporter [Actinomycetota bacterium]
MRVQIAALQAVLANRQLRRLVLAWMLTSVGVWGGLLALAVYAYDRGGGAAVGIVAMLRTLPGAPAAPMLALVVDRSSRRRVMIVSSSVRAALMLGIAAAVGRDAPLGVVYGLVVLLAIAGPAFRPAFVALLPRASRTPGELASANVVSSLGSNGGFLLGSLLVGFLLSATSAEVVFALLGGAFAATVLPLLGVDPDAPAEGDLNAGALSQATAGFRAVGADASLRELVVLVASLLFVDGALDVLVVVGALDFLDAGEAGAGVLNAAWGAGCVAGGGVVMVLLSRGRLTTGITLGALLLGGASAVAGLAPVFLVALVALVVFGVGYTLVEVAANTLMQRLTPDHMLGRVGGVIEITMVVAAAFGSLAAGLLIEVVGARASFVIVGALVPALILLRHRRLARLESGAPVAEREYRLLRGHQIFASLSVAEAERLANSLQEVRPAAGQEVIVEGELGDCFYLIAEGELDIFEHGTHCRTCGPGDGVGEIALLRDVPRTATVYARDGTVLLSLDRATFLQAVASQAPSLRAAHRVADARHKPG